MLQQMYPFWAAIVANLTAQLLKPVIRYIRTRDWDWHLALESGGFPSSHTSTVAALTLAVGITDNFSSTLFAVTLMFSLIKDIQILTQTRLDDPIYLTKVKEVLGHKWIEVFGGIILGLIIAGLMYFIR